MHICDKQTGKKFKLAASKNALIPIAAERGMYDFEFMGTPFSIENGLSQLESKAAVHIRKIIEDARLHPEDPEEKGTLAIFLAVQMVRTRAIRAINADVFARMRAWLVKEGAPADFFAPDSFVGEGENAEKALVARQIVNAHKDLAPSLVEKEWLLFKSDTHNPFLMGDHPLALFNDVERPGRGNLGIGVEGIQIHLPLSPTYTLALWCPTIPAMLRNFVSQMADKSELHSHLIEQHIAAWRDAIETLEALNSGQPISCRPENVLHFNSLQIVHSERFVFSSQDDFSLVDEMISVDPALRQGRRMSEMTEKF